MLQLLLSNHSPDQNKLLTDFSNWLITGIEKKIVDVSGASLNRENMWINFHCLRSSREFCDNSGLLRMPQLMIVQRLVKCLYSALITNYCQLHDREYH